MSLALCARLPDVTVLNLGGGFKVARVAGEETADLQKIGRPIAEAFRALAEATGRKLHLEVESGTFLVVIGGAGAYCSGMAAGNYNSFPLAAEVMISRDGAVELIRKRQMLDQVVQNEI